MKICVFIYFNQPFNLTFKDTNNLSHISSAMKLTPNVKKSEELQEQAINRKRKRQSGSFLVKDCRSDSQVTDLASSQLNKKSKIDHENKETIFDNLNGTFF